jgi:two-component system sensor histidine kinase KdpD
MQGIAHVGRTIDRGLERVSARNKKGWRQLSGTHNRFRMILGAIRPRKLRRAAPAVRPGSADRVSAVQLNNLREFTQRTLQMNLSDKPGQKLADYAHTLFELDAVALFDADLNEIYLSGEWTVDAGELAQNVYHFESSDDDPITGISRRVIRLGAVPIGSLVLRGSTHPAANSLLASVIAITFDRYRASANEGRIEAEREAEQMRSSVLDSLAHAYKTPLTAIRAASSGLSEMGHLSPAQAELVALIDEQATVLNELTTRLLTTARLDGHPDEGPVALRMEHVEVKPLIEDLVGALGERALGTTIRIAVGDEKLAVEGDRGLLSTLLMQYLDNACKYSDAGSAIAVRAEQANGEVLFSVHSYGPVIPRGDRERIFDRYYRSSNSSARAAGTGIGLSIAKRAALAHHGAVWVASDAREGTTFYAAIPQTGSALPAPGTSDSAGRRRSSL